jgi:hypothetical protein
MFSKVMDSYNSSKDKAQDSSDRRFEATARLVGITLQGKEERKTAKRQGKEERKTEVVRGTNATTLEQTRGIEARTSATHYSKLAEGLLGNPNTGGRTTGVFGADGRVEIGTTKPATRKPRTATAKPAAAKPSGGAAEGPVYSAKNPHPNNPWDVKTHRTEFVKYNKGTSVERGQSMKRFKAMGPK